MPRTLLVRKTASSGSESSGQDVLLVDRFAGFRAQFHHLGADHTGQDGPVERRGKQTAVGLYEQVGGRRLVRAPLFVDEECVVRSRLFCGTYRQERRREALRLHVGGGTESVEGDEVQWVIGELPHVDLDQHGRAALRRAGGDQHPAGAVGHFSPPGQFGDLAGDVVDRVRQVDVEGREPAAHAGHVLGEERRRASDELERLVESKALGEAAVQRRHASHGRPAQGVH